MRPLPENFKLHKYGIDVRLAQIEDSAFILSLRNSKRGQILHATDDDLQKQVEWMKEYKKREKEGIDYYFIYSFEGQPFGVNRIVDINYENKSCSGGSWICAEDTPFERSFATLLIVREIKFDIIGVDYSYGYTLKINKQIQRMEKFMGGEIVRETETEIFYQTNREQYLKGMVKVKKALSLTD